MKERGIPFKGAMVRAILAGTKTQTRRVMEAELKNGWEFGTPNEAGMVYGRITSPHPKRGRFGVFIRRENRDFPDTFEHNLIPCPYGGPGDHLWVREAWRSNDDLDPYSGARIAEMCMDAGYRTPWAPIHYEADGEQRNWEHTSTPPRDGPAKAGRYRHARFMPRWASRILLKVVSVRIERLQDISEADAIAEGGTEALPGWWSHEGLQWNDPGPRDVFGGTAIDSYRILWQQINGLDSWDANPFVWVIEFKRVEG